MKIKKSYYLLVVMVMGALFGVTKLQAQSYYNEVLGVTANASSEEIQKAYDEKISKLFASSDRDKNKQMDEILRAYNILLSDSKKRESYNQELAIVISEETAKASELKKGNFGFEIMNKAKNPIQVTVQNGGIDLVKEQYIKGSSGNSASKHGYMRISGLNLDEPTIVSVWVAARGTDKRPTAQYIIGGNGKTIFLTWDKNNFPRPQTGPWMGILKTTESGLSLENNISSEEIQWLEK